ncbi:hypothetical protein [Azospirillum sp.]|uniref:hypothetical protein n=1 Tax=Azospirillum sp. TaxID=34012 RepID=UPI00260AC5E6|nr:hypothetical protein [Azospirillum sp.]
MIQRDSLCCYYFVAAEQAVAVNDAQAGGTPLWPFVRNSLYPILAHDVLTHAEDAARARIIEHGEQSTARLGLPHGDHKHVSVEPFGASRSDKPILFLTRPIEHSGRTDDGFYAPIPDPWFELALDVGPAVKIEFLENDSLLRQPRCHPTLLMPWPPQAHFDRTRPLFDREALPALRALFLPLVEFSRDVFGLELAPIFPRIAGELLSCMTLRTLFDQQFDRMAPRALALVCYYHTVGMAATWAARARGLPVLELQHGTNGEHHPAYSHWTAVPEAGYEFLPDVFMTWGAASSNNIQRWMPMTSHPHRSVVGGRPGLRSDPDRDSVAAALNQKYTALRGRFRKIVLLTLSREPIAPFFTDLIAASPDDWFWAIRAHPVAREEEAVGSTPAGISSKLADCGIANAETEFASQASLATVLMWCDHHVTRQSSSYLEAAAFGVPTTFIASQARTLYADALRKRQCHYVDTTAELIDTVESGWLGLDRSVESNLIMDIECARSALSVALAKA